MTHPHDALAPVYDLVYQEDFAEFYHWLTDTTVDVIRGLLPARARIVEFGAGTGRMALPLAQAGYRVTAVEPSAPMLERLRAADEGDAIRCIQSTVQDYTGRTRHDLALCVFTVVIYLLTEDELQAALHSVRRSLKPGGRLLIDVPSRELFHDRRVRRRRLQRTVTTKPLGGDLFDYRETVVLGEELGGGRYADRFTVRCWSREQVLQAAAKAGLQLQQELSPHLGDSGSASLLLRCAPAATQTPSA